MHAHELEIGEPLVRRLLAAQFPQRRLDARNWLGARRPHQRHHRLGRDGRRRPRVRCPGDNAALFHEAERWLELVLSEPV